MSADGSGNNNDRLETVGNVMVDDPAITVRNCDVYYGETHAIRDVSLDIGRNEVISLIGPSGCGKSTFLRCLNRMNDTIDSARVDGEICLDGENIYARKVDPVLLRARVGMVFQKPNPFPKSIYENVAYGPRIHGLAQNRAELDDIVYSSLDRAGLYGEVKDRMEEPGTALSGGQQQRLCIARTIAVNPEVILMDEPCSALDPIATAKIEDLIEELRENFSIAIVTHSMQQAARVSQRTAYFHLGYLVEVGAYRHGVHQPDPQADRRLRHRADRLTTSEPLPRVRRHAPARKQAFDPPPGTARFWCDVFTANGQRPTAQRPTAAANERPGSGGDTPARLAVVTIAFGQAGIGREAVHRLAGQGRDHDIPHLQQLVQIDAGFQAHGIQHEHEILGDDIAAGARARTGSRRGRPARVDRGDAFFERGQRVGETEAAGIVQMHALQLVLPRPRRGSA